MKLKNKPILPSLKEKKRYLVYNIIVGQNRLFQAEEIKQEFNRKMLQYMGELGYAKAGVIFVNNPKYNQGIIRVNHKYVDPVKASLTLIENINNEKVVVRCKGVSGTLEGSNRFLS